MSNQIKCDRCGHIKEEERFVYITDKRTESSCAIIEYNIGCVVISIRKDMRSREVDGYIEYQIPNPESKKAFEEY